ncbi:MAG: DNA polymerase III subunit gamma/tau C-terminal domain-containing protein, partial [Wenzhouxiangellaceae bacterium]|nr:DNA polymerase III subunit gamma/tau C-terminal domain-containing protein [Wenzhouxiangellaceae bacterium]
ALLKTLEEPPEHVKFVLATTDPQKIPVTILSRCMQFNLRRLSVEQIAGQLAAILESESIDHEDAAVAMLARAADGSMRDGLSLLDQALAGESGSLKAEAVEEMLGSVEQRHLNEIVEALIDGDAKRALTAVSEVFSLARDLSRLLGDLAEMLHRIALIQQVPDYRDDARPDWEQLVEYAGGMDPEDVQLHYQIAVTGRRDLGLAPSMRTGCEMTILRMFAFRPAGAGTSGEADEASEPAGSAATVREAAGRSSRPAPRSPASEGRRDAATTAESRPPTEPARPAETVREPDRAVTDAERPAAPTPENWPETLARLGLNGSVRAVAGLLALDRIDEHGVEFRVAEDDMTLLTKRFRASLTEALERHVGRKLKLAFHPVDDGESLETPARIAERDQARAQADAETAAEHDPLVQRMKETFDAEIVPGSVRPTPPRT